MGESSPRLTDSEVRALENFIEQLIYRTMPSTERGLMAALTEVSEEA